MKIAICYFGMTRSTKKVYQSHHTFLFSILKNANIEYDVFMHTWKTNNNANVIWDSAINMIDYDEYKLLSPNYYQIDNQDDFLQTIDFSNYFYEDLYNKHGDCDEGEWHPFLIRNHICALESQKRVTDLVLSKGGQDYTHVMYIRPDVEIHTPFFVNFLNINIDGIALPNFPYYCEGYNDRMAIVPYMNCEKYGKRIDELAEFRKKSGRIVSEKYVKFIVDKYYSNQKLFMGEFFFSIVRP